MENSQFETLLLAINGLRNEVNVKIEDLRTEVHSGFQEIRSDLRVIREQTATTVVAVAEVKSRVTKLENRTTAL